MADIQQTNPVADTLSSWRAFLSAKIDDADAISHLLNALDTAFGYTCYADQEAKSTELDDLATRKKTWEKADAFCRHDQRILAAHRYSQLTVKKDGPVGELKDKFRSLGKKLEHVGDLMESEAKLQSQLLDLLDAVQGTYKTRYLQAFDEVTGKCEAGPLEIDNLPDYSSVQGHRRAGQDRRPQQRQRGYAQRRTWRATKTVCFSHRWTVTLSKPLEAPTAARRLLIACGSGRHDSWPRLKTAWREPRLRSSRPS